MLISVYYLLISNDALERQIVVVAANDVRQYAKYDIPTMSASVNLRTAFVVHYVDLRRSFKTIRLVRSIEWYRPIYSSDFIYYYLTRMASRLECLFFLFKYRALLLPSGILNI